MERATIDGVELAYEVSGAGEPVVFIHGAFIAETFRPLVDESSLGEKYQLVVYHRRGYGESGSVSEPVGMARQAADCRALLDHLEIGRAHVVGHSYGGAVALQLALDAPEYVHSLALLEPALMVGESAEGYRESLAGAIERYREAGAAAVVDEALEARWPGYREPLERALPGAFEQAVADAETTVEYELGGLLDWSFTEARSSASACRPGPRA